MHTIDNTEERRRLRWDSGIATWLRRHRIGAACYALLVPLVFAGGVLAYGYWAPNAGHMVNVELAGSAKEIRKLIAADPGAYGHALWVDYGFIAAYGIAVFAGCALGWALSRTT